MKKSSSAVKGRIVSAAWSLFYRFGYDGTTIDDIVEVSQTSKGSFYHYFSTKADLLGSLSYLFDSKYEELVEAMDRDMDPIEKLLFLNEELFLMIENTVPCNLLAQLFASQLTVKGERHLLDQDRTYYKLLRQIAVEGKEQGLFRDDQTVNDITRAYAMYERAVMYDWCISSGNYSLCQYSQRQLPLFLRGMLKEP